MTMMTESTQNFLLILLLRIGFMAALASLLVALRPFREVVRGERTVPVWRMARVLLEAAVLGAGIMARISISSLASDLSMEGAFLIGWVHGPLVGLLVGLGLGLLEGWGGHWIALAYLPLVAMAAGQLSFRFHDAAMWTAGMRSGDRKIASDTAICIIVLTVLVIVWLFLGLFDAAPEMPHINGLLTFAGATLGAVISVVVPLYIWRGFRMEAELEKRTRQMDKVRMESLMERFRPHFLFNTLSTIVSLMRTDVEGARNMTLKLAGLLRRSMNEGEGFVPLKEEMRFARDYLDIEYIRHGDRLKIIESIEEKTLDTAVPRMILQPLLENAILHGIDPKVEGGTVTIKARKSGDFLRITVADDGLGIDDPPREGIGLGNLRARLDTAYGPYKARLEIEGDSETGTRAILWIPWERGLS